jgi:serine protease Do
MYDSNNYSYSNGSFTPVDPEQKPPKKSGGVGKVIAGLLAVVVIGGASGYGGAYLARSNSDAISASADASSETTTFTQTTTVSSSASAEESASASALGNVSSSDGGLTTKQVINKVTPSVALITAKFTDSSSGSTGTGIVFSSDGYIVTNAHVITTEVETYVKDNTSSSSDPFSSFFGNFYGGGYTTKTEVVQADTVTVTLSDGTEYDAKIIGSDSNTDLAVLKIEATGLTAAEIGDSSVLEMGDTAITLGYPLGLGLSASTGIISGLDKEMSVEVAGGTATMTLIQTDAAINPGNSGGPLLNANGQVVGITSSKIVSSSVDGVGFAIPITDALPILNELMTTGTVKSTVPKIGITGTEITSAVKRYYNLPVDTGVLVASVEAGSCAESAGLEEGDVIVAADGTEISTMDELVEIKNKHKAGENMTLTLARSDGNIDVELVLDADES